MLQVAAYRPLLDRILSDAGLPPETLELVPDLQIWCHNSGVGEDQPFRQARCLCRISDRACHIVMVEVLTDDMISRGKDAMEFHGFSSEIMSLDTDTKYLIHLMLHEVACHVLQTTEQEQRDRWAFERVSKYAI